MKPAESKDRLAVLDGLRGVAAIAVVLLHGDEIFNLGWTPHHAYLAVDFFFLMSGYVIARAFDRRLREGWLGGFMRRRLIRLYPFIIVGGFIGFLVLLFRSLFTHALSIPQALLDFISSALVIPTPPLLSPVWRIYPADPPLWSLFYEIIANLIYAIAAPYLKGARLWGLVGLSGLALAYAMFALNGGDFGLDHFDLGGLRVMFSFFLGVGIYRLQDTNLKRVSLPALAVPLIFGVLALMLLAPTTSGTPLALGWPYDMIAVFLVFPTLLVASLAVPAGGATSTTVFTTLGLLSYPIYALHHPFMRLVSGMAFHKSAIAGRTLGMGLSFVAIVALSWGLAKVYDEPVRAWLTGLTAPKIKATPTPSVI